MTGSAEIHARLAASLGLDAATSARLRRREVDLFTRNLIPRVPVIEAAWDLKRSGRRIILVADCRFDRADIETMLLWHGINFYDALYPTGALGVSKLDGSLWDLILRCEALPPALITHVGDDERLDLLSASARQFRDVVQVMRPLAFCRHVLQPREESQKAEPS